MDLRRSGPTQAWTVLYQGGNRMTYHSVTTAYVDPETGTLHIMHGGETVAAYSRGSWISVHPA
jgi:hypothetical protein